MSSMQAGRELDATVARALGWADVRPNHYTGMFGVWYGRPLQPQPWDSPQDKAKGISLVPYFSTDISAAMQVFASVETMHGLLWTIERWPDEYSISLILPLNDPNYPPWAQAKDEWTSDDPSLPVAICTVCLKAMERLNGAPS